MKQLQVKFIEIPDECTAEFINDILLQPNGETNLAQIIYNCLYKVSHNMINIDTTPNQTNSKIEIIQTNEINNPVVSTEAVSNIMDAIKQLSDKIDNYGISLEEIRQSSKTSVNDKIKPNDVFNTDDLGEIVTPVIIKIESNETIENELSFEQLNSIMESLNGLAK